MAKHDLVVVLLHFYGDSYDGGGDGLGSGLAGIAGDEALAPTDFLASVSLGTRAPGNRWEHLRNIVGTGTLCLYQG